MVAITLVVVLFLLLIICCCVFAADNLLLCVVCGVKIVTAVGAIHFLAISHLLGNNKQSYGYIYKFIIIF